MGVRFTGINELKRKLKRNTDMTVVKRVVYLNGSEMQRKAQRNAPVDTGNLKRSIGLEISDEGLTATVGPSAEYAPYPEFGTRYMEAQPYIGPAFKDQKEQFKQDLNKLTK